MMLTYRTTSLSLLLLLVLAGFTLHTAGAQTGTMPLSVRAVRLTADNVPRGAAVTGVLIISGKAGAQGAIVSLACDDPAALNVPATVVVPAGRTAAPFTLRAGQITQAKTVTLRAGLGRTPEQRTVITVRPPALAVLRIAPETVEGGSEVVGFLAVEDGVAPETRVRISSSDPDLLCPTPETLRLPADQREPVPSFTLSTEPVTTPRTVTLTATANGFTRTVTVRIIPKSKSKSVPKPVPKPSSQSQSAANVEKSAR
jgi:hypothetical protein